MDVDVRGSDGEVRGFRKGSRFLFESGMGFPFSSVPFGGTISRSV